MKAIGYIRVSTEDQAREGVSLDNQEAKIRDYASLHDLDLVETIRDEGASGKTLDREGMTQLLNMVETGKVEAIIVYKLDRLSRRTLDTLTLIESFEKCGIAFHSISERIDTKSAQGRFFLTIISALAQMERDLIAERTRDALSHKKSIGEWPAGRVPFGFQIVDGRLIEDPQQMALIQKAKRLRRAGKSIRTIADTIGVSRSVIHRLLNVNLRTLKAKYINDLHT